MKIYSTAQAVGFKGWLDDIPAVPIEEGVKKMSITAEKKSELINEFKLADGDTGSPEVQVAILSSRISSLTEHFRTHQKDDHSRRGLFKLIAQRRKLLDYVKAKDENRYRVLIEKLGLRR